MAASRPLLGRSDVPEHVRALTSTDVLAVEHEIIDRIAQLAEAKTVTLVEGERIGVGDRIATRRNDHDADVANRETWTVLACDDGALIVHGDAGKRVPPPDCVRQHVELAYATTAYGAPGSTVPISDPPPMCRRRNRGH